MKLDVVKQVIEKFEDVEIIISDNNKKPDSLFFNKEHKVRHFKSIDEITEFAKDKFNITDERLFDIYTFSLKFPNDNYIAFDIDRKDGKDGFVKLKELSKELGQLPLTYTENTPSGGLHYYFKLPEKLHLSSTEIKVQNNTNTGLEIKQHAKITIADGDRYTIVNDLPVSTLPVNWVEFLKQNYSKSEKKPTFNYIDKPTVADDSNKAISDAYDYAVSQKGYPTNGNRYYFAYTFGMAMALNGVQEFEAQRQYNLVGGEYQQFEKQIESAYYTCDNPGKWAHMYCDDVQKYFEIPKKDPEIKKEKKFIVLKEGQYLSDIANQINLSNKFIYIVSPTGSGKTYYSIETLSEKFPDKHIVILLPKIIAVKQKITSYEGIEGIFDKKTYNIDYSKHAGTFDSFRKLPKEIDPNDCIVVIDEAHTLSEAINYRTDAIKYILRNYQNFHKVIMMSATPTVIPSEFERIDVVNEKEPKIKFNIIKYLPKDKIFNVVDGQLLQNKINLIYVNDKKRIESFCQAINRRPERKAYPLYRDAEIESKTPELYNTIVNNSNIPDDTSEIIMTVFGEEALDIYLSEGQNLGSANFLYTHDYSITNIIQTINRFRNSNFEVINLYIPEIIDDDKDDEEKKYDLDCKFDFERELIVERAKVEGICYIHSTRAMDFHPLRSNDSNIRPYKFYLSTDEKIVTIQVDDYTIKPCEFGLYYRTMEAYKYHLLIVNPYQIKDDMIKAGFELNEEKFVKPNSNINEEMKEFNKLNSIEKAKRWAEWVDEIDDDFEKTLKKSENDQYKRYIIPSDIRECDVRVIILLNWGFDFDEAKKKVKALGHDTKKFNNFKRKIFLQYLRKNRIDKLINKISNSFVVGNLYTNGEIVQKIIKIHEDYLRYNSFSEEFVECMGLDNIPQEIKNLRNYSFLSSSNNIMKYFGQLYNIHRTSDTVDGKKVDVYRILS